MLRDLRGQLDKPRHDLPDDFKRGGEDLAAFYNKLAYGNWTSPDAFLEHHREFIQTGKFLICRCLSTLEAPTRVVQDGGWYDRLVSAIHVADPAKLRDNNLSIVTFNYDRSIDFRLHKYSEHHFGMPSKDAWQLLTDSIPIVHVHGTLGEYPRWDYGDQSSVWERAQDIKIISEIAENTQEFQRAAALLNGAERVVVFGFGFAPDNVRRLCFFVEQNQEERDVVVSTGPHPGDACRRATTKWLAKWGLEADRHHFAVSANEIFDVYLNPFA